MPNSCSGPVIDEYHEAKEAIHMTDRKNGWSGVNDMSMAWIQRCGKDEAVMI